MSDNPIAGLLIVIAVAALCLVRALGPAAFVAAPGSFLAFGQSDLALCAPEREEHCKCHLGFGPEHQREQVAHLVIYERPEAHALADCCAERGALFEFERADVVSDGGKGR